ncbi:hypothetical protein VLK31_22855 [Variovorax sp. H27-G14]|uniref:hypothetical protein n=1 Tax=Variovorax sp. H27-G14 TaxID=3111914 RepID=UPI0038FCC648
MTSIAAGIDWFGKPTNATGLTIEQRAAFLSTIFLNHFVSSTMSSDQISETVPRISEALADARYCATFEIAGQARNRVEFQAETVNAGCSNSEHPAAWLVTLAVARSQSGRLSSSMKRHRKQNPAGADIRGCASGVGLRLIADPRPSR